MSEFSRLTEEAKQGIKDIQLEVQKQSGEKPSEGEVVQGLLEAIDRETAAVFAHKARKDRRDRRRKDSGSEFDDLFTL